MKQYKDAIGYLGYLALRSYKLLTVADGAPRLSLTKYFHNHFLQVSLTIFFTMATS